MTAEELVTAAMELSQCSTAFRARVGTNTGIGSEALVVDGTDEQKRRYLPLLASGELTGCFALTEENAGSEATNLSTTARPEGNGWVIDGSKRFITNAPIAGLFTVLARTDPESSGSRGISAFLVEAGHARTDRRQTVSQDGPGRVARVGCLSRRLPDSR